MNKLGVLAFGILALLGAALWYLASDSLNFYLKHKIETDGKALTSYTTEVAKVEVDDVAGITVFESIRFLAPKKLKVSESSETSIFAVDKIKLVLDKESLNKAPIVIEELIISSPQFNASLTLEQRNNATQEMLAAIEKSVTLIKAQHAQTDEQLEPFFFVKKATVVNEDNQERVFVFDDNHTKQGTPVRLLATEIISTLLTETIHLPSH